jgi:mannan endo-1,4-beta-mannosidase
LGRAVKVDFAVRDGFQRLCQQFLLRFAAFCVQCNKVAAEGGADSSDLTGEVIDVKQAILLAVALSMFSAAATARAQFYRLEAESGQRFGTQIASSVPGYSGTGYVTGFNASDGSDYFQLQANVPDGLYELWVGYRSQYGNKGYNYRVDAVQGSGTFNQSSTFTSDRAGVFNLTGATNTLGIYQGWGYYDVDYLELRPFTPPQLQPIAAQLSDPQADHHTQLLMNYLTSQYGQKTLSGQQHQSSENLAFPVQSYLSKSGGIVPAIRASDFIEYSPTRIQNGANPRNETEQTIQWAKGTGGIVSMSWHWNAPANLVNTQCGSSCGENDWPWWRGFYTQGTTFDLPGALANPAGSDYQLILRDVDAIANELQKFEDAGVPVIWRPLHEAQGGWFWWGAHGPETFKELWHVVYDRLTNHHGLHNLIWEFTSSAAIGNHLEWYPGDEEVDMIGLDVYTDASSNMSGEWYDVLEHYNGRKLIALSETGTLPNADVMDQWGIDWSYFSPWSGSFVDAMSPAALQALLNDEDVITLSELPILPWNNLAAALPGDYNLDGTVNAADYTVWRNSFGRTGTGLAADGDGNGTIDNGDYDVWQLYFGETAAGSGSSVPEPNAVLLGVAGVTFARRFRSLRLRAVAR